MQYYILQYDYLIDETFKDKKIKYGLKQILLNNLILRKKI